MKFLRETMRCYFFFQMGEGILLDKSNNGRIGRQFVELGYLCRVVLKKLVKEVGELCRISGLKNP